MDKTDRSILNLLQKDGKITIKEIAERLNLTTTPIFERVKKLEREGFIKSYKAILDRKKAGLQLMVFCNVTLNLHQTDYLKKFEKDIQQFPEVVECYHVAGMFDYLIKIYAEDMESYQYFLSNKLASLENISKVQSSFVMTEVKDFSFLPIP
ncbi:Lrp/AsnC family transcriptional regulator [Aquimarina sp. MMG015]|uniref:Lrp/AsnC family transcriptional regulator n=1 Tax=unclassified Aquimarina TaxID=2627091 RepID=UPI000E555038|nr:MULTISPECIES: Lrp/AsnC family transcriptional regulator [unclassified Aquimarina]AXT54865.1 Lrp/AsnC family transcriptional regulator [Aquimarina sp. AD1]MBQ4804721.1 Lrp/AsnC family transcriptional regulator [Aquimarina sp. MMG015]RKN07445.1 winged helix-turn-helix transcriptional regulator [Aquimarina sp. AD1]